MDIRDAHKRRSHTEAHWFMVTRTQTNTPTGTHETAETEPVYPKSSPWFPGIGSTLSFSVSERKITHDGRRAWLWPRRSDSRRRGEEAPQRGCFVKLMPELTWSGVQESDARNLELSHQQPLPSPPLLPTSNDIVSKRRRPLLLYGTEDGWAALCFNSSSSFEKKKKKRINK